MKTTIALCLSAIAAIFIFSAWAEDPAPDKAVVVQKWQHLGLQRDSAKPFSDPEFAKQINELGDKGWELVSVLNFMTEGTTTKTVYYFKRPKE